QARRVADAGEDVEAAGQAVAVVVEQVGADLGPGQHLAGAAHLPHAVDAGLRPCLARPRPVGAGRAVVAGAGRAVGAGAAARRAGGARRVLAADQAVAVVVGHGGAVLGGPRDGAPAGAPGEELGGPAPLRAVPAGA